MMVKDCKIDKGITASKDENIYEISKKMGQNKSIIIVEKDKPIGIITYRDIVSRVLSKGKDPVKTKAKDIMTKPVFSAKLDDDVVKLSEKMFKKDFLSMPVVDKKGNYIGLLTVYSLIGVLRKLKIK